MGLDMYLLRMEKLSEKEIQSCKLNGIPDNMLLFDKHGVDEDSLGRLGIDDLMPYLSEIEVVRECFDVDRIRSDYGIPQDVPGAIRSFINGVVTIRYEWLEGEETQSKIVEFDATKEYVVERSVPCYIVKCEQVYYWRKAYETADKIEELYGCKQENCGYYHLTPDILSAMSDSGCFDGYFPYKFDKNIFYHYWA